MTITDSPEIQGALALIDAQLEGERQDRKVPAISAGVVYDQDLIWQRGYGQSNREQGIDGDENTIYRIASITKLFTATMLMQLRDAGKLQLDDPIEKYLPEFKVKSSFPDARPPTFRQMVSHGSGLTREGDHVGWKTLDMPNIETLLKLAQASEMRFPTMTEPKYSNLGIAIMGHALSKIAGKPYAQYITEHILQPLGMTSSGFDRSRFDPAHLAVGYHRNEAGEYFAAGHWDEQGFIPGGGMYSTVRDITRFIALQFRDAPAGAADGAQILGGSTLREMHMPVIVTPDFESGYGIGWGIRRVAGCKVIGHSGGLPGYTTNITLVPALKLATIVFTNYGTDPVAIAQTMLETLIPVFRRHFARQEADASPETVAGWQKYVGRYFGRSSDDFLDVEIIKNRLMLTTPGAAANTFIRLLPQDNGRFKMQGGASSGDIVTFETDSDGKITGMMLGAYPLTRK